MAPSDIDGFASSRLGTQEHWQDQYETELKSFDESGLEGESTLSVNRLAVKTLRLCHCTVWFGIDAEEDMVDWALENIPPEQKPSILDGTPPGLSSSPFSVLIPSAVGTGNAHLLCAFAEAGYRASLMTGVDYAPAAVSLGASLCKSKGYPEVDLRCCDVMGEEVARPEGQEGWDLVLDKGVRSQNATLQVRDD